ncbi:hypothetical protein [Natronococcus jeotgali]|uniref:Uncharacterized protein n=1 Tax=Natronococcus jeotgali DSM 18795 TaxID=1227498 RepID=L9Y1H1_9EURY|nr:hypothetical protein [Natronococcus jeotgali]ELY66728.1 hypothetical protein C492_00454 [Natronococcus jeotgali DSM 18795]
MSDQTTVSLRPSHKPAVDEAQEALADRLGFRPTKGQTIVHACRSILGDVTHDEANELLVLTDSEAFEEFLGADGDLESEARP